MKLTLIRTTKRLLISAVEFCVLGLLLVLSVIATALVTVCSGSENSGPASTVLVFGCFMSLVAFVVVRRKTRPWRFEYDATGWALAQAERRLHPVRARVKRTAKRILIWVPSMIAALVLFFYPIATHLVRPGGFHSSGYRVPIPWTFTIILSPNSSPDFVSAFFTSKGRGRFGTTPFIVLPFWETFEPISFISFEAQRAEPASFMIETAKTRAGPEIFKREFWAADHEFTCLQYRPSRRFGTWPADGFEWYVNCETAVPVKQRKLYIEFSGHEEDLPTFYRIIESVVVSDSQRD